jgi:hypothetical protein
MRKAKRLAFLGSLVLMTSAQAADSEVTDSNAWGVLGNRFVDVLGPVQTAGHWTVRGTFGKVRLKDGISEQILLPEISVGLPYGFEFRLLDEFVSVSGGDTGEGAETNGLWLPELRWAMGAPGTKRFNPTFGIGAEIVPADADILRASFYLSDSPSDSLAWASSFTYQKRMGGDKELELIGKFGVHHVFQPMRLSLGVEAKAEHAKTSGPGAETIQEFLLGPALVWRMSDHMVLRVGSQFGLTSKAPKSESSISLEYRR